MTTTEPGVEPLNHRAKKSIKDHIGIIISNLNTEHVLSFDRQQWMAKHLANFVLEATLKFIAGQKEHGDNIDSVDLRRELYGEQLDAFWYHAAMTDTLTKPIIKSDDAN